MEHMMFLGQIMYCIIAALVVALLWEHSRLREVERRLDEMEDVSDLHTDSLIAILRRSGD